MAGFKIGSVEDRRFQDFMMSFSPYNFMNGEITQYKDVSISSLFSERHGLSTFLSLIEELVYK